MGILKIDKHEKTTHTKEETDIDFRNAYILIENL